MYAVIHTRSDIFFVIKRLSQYFSDSATHHEQALQILFRYVRFIINLNIVYGEELNKSESLDLTFKLKAFSDFDYAVDRLNKKLILEYVYMFVEELIA